MFFFIKETSYYGLLSTTAIPALVPTGETVSLPFYSGCRYAAIPARSSQEVVVFKEDWWTNNHYINPSGKNCYTPVSWKTWSACVPFTQFSYCWSEGTVLSDSCATDFNCLVWVWYIIWGSWWDSEAWVTSG